MNRIVEFFVTLIVLIFFIVVVNQGFSHFNVRIGPVLNELLTLVLAVVITFALYVIIFQVKNRVSTS